MKQIKTTDEFDLQQCLKGLGVLLMHSHSHLYEFCYFLTFKKALKSMASEFSNASLQPIEDIDFFEDIDDPLVRHGYATFILIVDYLQPFLLRYGYEEASLYANEENVVQAYRYSPTYTFAMKRKSYIKLALAYQRHVEELSHSFYYYCCALSLKSYQIPLRMRTQLAYHAEGSFRFLNLDDYEVASLMELIEALQRQEVWLKGILRR